MDAMMRRGFRACLRRIHGLGPPADDELVDRVLDERARVRLVEQAPGIRFVLSEEQRHVAVDIQVVWAELGVRDVNRLRTRPPLRLAQLGPRGIRIRPPGIAEPDGGQDVQRRRIGTAIGRADPDDDVAGCDLGVLDLDVEVLVAGEDARIEQFVLELVPGALAVGLHQIVVRIGTLRIFVEPLHVGVRRRGVEIEVVLLHVLPVIPLGIGEAEETFLENRIAAVPERDRKTHPLVVVGNTGKPVLAPVVGARPRVVVGEVVPRVAIGAVILAHGSPLPLAEVGAPPAPSHALLASRVETSLFLPGGAGGRARVVAHEFLKSLGKRTQTACHATSCRSPL